MFRKLGAFLFLILVCQSCGTGRQYSIDKSSPKRTYRVKIEVTPGNRALPFQRPDQRCKIQYFKGQQEMGGAEGDCRQDEYESSLAEGWQVVEWLADNVVRVGRDRSDQPFSDQVVAQTRLETP